jgi:hypothetical protein
MCDDTEPLSPDEIRSNGWNIGIRGVQDEESEQHSTQTSEQTQTAPPQQVKVPDRVSGRQKKMHATKLDDFLW